MKTIKLKKYVTDKGLHLDDKRILKLKDQKVEIIIVPDRSKEKKEFMKFAGALNNNDAIEMYQLVKDCRKIEENTWQ